MRELLSDGDCCGGGARPLALDVERDVTPASFAFIEPDADKRGVVEPPAPAPLIIAFKTTTTTKTTHI